MSTVCYNSSFGGDVNAWNANQQDYLDCPEDFYVPAMAQANAITKVKPSNPIMKCKPLFKGAASAAYGTSVPIAFFPWRSTKAGKPTRTSFLPGLKGKLRFATGTFATLWHVRVG